MKKSILVIAALIFAQLSFAQIFSWGVKGGLNSSKISFDDFAIEEGPTVSIKPEYYNIAEGTFDPKLFIYDDNNEIIMVNPKALDITMPKVSFTPSSYEMGYHFGAFARFKLLNIFIQPEIIFSQTNATINVSDPEKAFQDAVENTSKIKYSNFDIPIMVGVKFGPARVNAGPVATFKLANKVENASEEVNKMLNDFTAVTKKATFGGQVGAGIDILKTVTLDVRYEFGLSKLGDKVNIASHEFNTDQRQNQFLMSLGIMF